MKLTDFMIKDVIKKYKLCTFKKVIIQMYMHEGHKSFLYITLTDTHNQELHFTTDGAYSEYEKKRISIPYIVYIFDRFESIRKACRMLDFLI